MSIRTKLKLSATQVGVAAAVLGGAAGLAIAAGATPAPSLLQLASSDEAPGDISGPCDEPENADKPECVGVSVPDSTPTTDAPTSTTPPDTTSATAPGTPGAAVPDQGPKTIDAAGAGTITYGFAGGSFELLDATPNPGWRVEVEQGAGAEIDLDFRSGTQRVHVDIEFEDGGIRDRVRFRDDADDTRIETTNGVVTDDRGGEDGTDDDRDDDRDDDHDDDRDHDDRDSSGPGNDDDRDDDRGDDPADDRDDDRDHDDRDNSGPGNADDRDDD